MAERDRARQRRDPRPDRHQHHGEERLDPELEAGVPAGVHGGGCEDGEEDVRFHGRLGRADRAEAACPDARRDGPRNQS